MKDASALRRHSHLVAVAILILALFFYLYRIDRWLMDDDEGGFCYAAWHISEGQAPYRDFLTEQVPLFLYWGSALVRQFGPSVMPLRYVTVLATLLAAYLLYLTAREAFGYRVALLSLPLFLMHKDIYLIARFFRPEAYMLLFSALGAYVLVRACSDHRRAGLFVAGALFGLGFLFKLFAVLPAAGCGLFTLHQWYRSKDRRWIRDLLMLSAGFAATAGAVFVAFQARYPTFLDALFKLHVMQGAERSWLQVLANGLQFYWSYFVGNPTLLLLAALGAASAVVTQTDMSTFLVWQIPTAVVFLLMSRDLQDRHLVYLVPVLCALAALALERILTGSLWPLTARKSTGQIKTAREQLWAAAGIAIAILALWPSWREDLDVASWEGTGTVQLAQYIRANTSPDDVVLCEYNELNFFAQRRNTYLGADLSNVTTSSGRITGAALSQEIEADNVQMVWINTYGGASHLVSLRDYDDFYHFVQSHFLLVGLFQRSYETFEVYDRRDLMPLLPGAEFSGKLALTGADLRNQAIPSGDVLSVALRWQALQLMGRNYTVSLRLLDAQGHCYGQKDMLLERIFTSQLPANQQKVEHAPTSQWSSGMQVIDECMLPVMPGTPPGTYTLAVVLYDLASGEVLQARDAAGQAEGTAYPLATVEVTRPESAPAIEELAMQRQLVQDFGGTLRLLGAGPIGEAARPGDSLDLVLFWQALHEPERDWQLLLRVRGGDGSVLSEGRFELANAAYPTSRWLEQEVVMGQYDLALDRTAPSGSAQLTLNLADAATGQRMLEQDYALANLSITGRSRQFTAPETIQHTLAVNLSNRILLVGYDLAKDAASPGGLLHLTLYWQALTTMDTSYTVFTHLLGGDGRLWGQRDGVPLQGTYPTTGWLPGEVVSDTYEIEVHPDAPPGDYLLEVGMYDAVSSGRLPVLDAQGQRADDRVLLATVRIGQQISMQNGLHNPLPVPSLPVRCVPAMAG